MKFSTKQWIGFLIAFTLLAGILAPVGFRHFSEIRIASSLLVILSLVFLMLGMACQFMVWHQSISSVAGVMPKTSTFISHALTIWGKYIPGKVWSVVGRASLLSYYSDVSLSKLMFASSIAQLNMIIAGLIISVPYLVAMGILGKSGLTPGIVIAGIILVIVWVLAMSFSRVKTDGDMSWKGRWRETLSIGILALAAWLLWGLGFHYLLAGLGHPSGPLENIITFTGGTTAGILAVITPGGMGVREGAISAILHFREFDWATAATIAIIARIWFVFGEGLLFLTGWNVHRVWRDKGI